MAGGETKITVIDENASLLLASAFIATILLLFMKSKLQYCTDHVRFAISNGHYAIKIERHTKRDSGNEKWAFPENLQLPALSARFLVFVW